LLDDDRRQARLDGRVVGNVLTGWATTDHDDVPFATIRVDRCVHRAKLL